MSEVRSLDADNRMCDYGPVTLFDTIHIDRAVACAHECGCCDRVTVTIMARNALDGGFVAMSMDRSLALELLQSLAAAIANPEPSTSDTWYVEVPGDWRSV